MTDKPTKVIVDCSTGVTTEVELTAEEIAQREADAAAFAEIKAAEDAAAQAAAAKASAAVAVTLAQVVDSLVVQESK